MKNFDINSYLHIFNILLCLSMFVMYLIFFIVAHFAPNWILPICFIILCIFAKIFLLYVLFSIFGKSYPHSTMNKIAEELKNSKSSRKSAILLVFAYDAVIILYCVLFFLLKEYRIEWGYIPVYEILTLGGVCMFYISLFGIWKMQNRLKNI